MKTEASVATRPSPSYLTTVGDHATWYFQAVVVSSGGLSAQVGDTVNGQLTYTILSPASYSDDGCTAYRSVTSSATFTVHLQTYSLSGGPEGQAVSFTSCNNENTPSLLVNAKLNGSAAQIEVFNPADNLDFPLAPPALTQDPRRFSYQAPGSAPPPPPPPPPPPAGPTAGPPPPPPSGPFINAQLTKLYVGLQTKDDCKNNGWAQFGFKNQGQCVRFIETGKDSR